MAHAAITAPDGHRLKVYRLRHDDGNHWLSGNWSYPDGGNPPLDRDAIRLPVSATWS